MRPAGIRVRAARIRVAGTRAAGIPVRTVVLRLAGIRVWLVAPHPAGIQARPAALPAADMRARTGGIPVADIRSLIGIRRVWLVVLRPAGILARPAVSPAADMRARTGGIPVADIRSPIGIRRVWPPADRTTAEPSSDQRAAARLGLAVPPPEPRAVTAADTPAARPSSDPIVNTAVPAAGAVPAPTTRRWVGSVVPPVRSCAQSTTPSDFPATHRWWDMRGHCGMLAFAARRSSTKFAMASATSSGSVTGSQ